MNLFKKSQKWPDCEPDHEGCRTLGMAINGIPYKKSEVSPGRWQWIVDEEAQKRGHEAEQYRRDLYWALRSRVLTDDEMQQVERYGDSLNIDPMTPYYAEEKKRELNDALLTQYKMKCHALSSQRPDKVKATG